MATKKEQQPDPAFGKAPEPEQMVVSEQPEPKAPIEVKPEPVLERSPEPTSKTVVLTEYHGLSDDERRRVAKTKSDFGELIGYLKSLRDSVHDSEAQRMYSVAITNAETASMWAVRAITWRG